MWTFVPFALWLMACIPMLCIPAEGLTNPADVRALRPLAQRLGRAANSEAAAQWPHSSSQDPCGPYGASCGSIHPYASGIPSHPCAWEGVACTRWRVVGLDLPCCKGSRHGAYLKGPLPPSLGNLTALQYLSLGGNQLTGSLPARPRWQDLKYLDLHGNGFSGTLPPDWGSIMSQLEHLDLGNNQQLAGVLPAAWSQLHKLQYLDLSVNNLQGTIPSSWTGMTSLQHLLLDNNCGLCGDVPFWTSSGNTSLVRERPSTMLVTTHHTSLCENCNLFGVGACSDYDVRAPIIAVCVVLGSFGLCLLHRHLLECYRQHRTGRSGDNHALINNANNAPQLVESGGLVKIIRPSRNIPSYECYVEVSVGRTSSDAADASSQGGIRPSATVSNAAEAGCSARLAAEATAAAGSASLQETPVAAAAAVGAAALPQPTASGTRHGVSCGDICCSDMPAAVPTRARSQSHVPTVIVMPDKQHLALAVPDPSALTGQEGCAGSCSSRSHSSQGSNLDNSRRAGGVSSSSVGPTLVPPDVEFAVIAGAVMSPQLEQQQGPRTLLGRTYTTSMDRLGRAGHSLLHSGLAMLIRPVRNENTMATGAVVLG